MDKMRFDGAVASHIAGEIDTALGGSKSRVDKIHHPGKDALVFTMRSREGSHKLLFSLSAQRAYVCLTRQQFENPPEPSMFCMLLRKRLTGAALSSVRQEGLDRILYFDFNGTDDIGNPAKHTLVAELFGRRPNLILLDEKGMIAEALKRVDFTQLRPIWPGQAYTPPPVNGKQPEGNGIALPEQFETWSQFLDDFYGEADRAQRLKQKTASLRQLLSNRIARLHKKIILQRQELAQAGNRENLRIHAELILANKARLEQDSAAKGSSAYLLENYYDGNHLVSVQVNPALGPGANAQRLFKAYQKAKNAANLLGDLIAEGEEQLLYLESVEELLARAQTQPEIDALRMELEAMGYCKTTRSGKASANAKRKKTAPLPPLQCRTSEGLTVLVGRNNMQNDQLSFKTAKANDLWFHTQGYPGSHVILCTENKEPGEQSILEAARIAALHSKARNSTAAVDYTPARLLKKPKGAPPGKVIYHTYKTMIADGGEAFGRD